MIEKNLDNNFAVGVILTDLSKTFDCVRLNLLVAKLSTYNFSDGALSYIYSCMTNCRQCVRINNIYNHLETKILGAPQESLLELILFSLSINDLFLLVVLLSLYNFEDDNNISFFTAQIQV